MTMKPSCILVTRPIQDAEPIARTLIEKGHEVIVEPMLQIRFRSEAGGELSAAISKSPQLLMVTSANGIRALAEMTKRRDFNIVTVGDASRILALKLGFTKVKATGGNASAMFKYVVKNYKPVGGRLLHISGSEVALNLKKVLEGESFIVDRVVLYSAQPAEGFSEKLIEKLKSGKVDAALFFSKRTLKVFMNIVEKEGLMGTLAKIKFLCLSDKVAEEAKKHEWAVVHSAKIPTADSLLSLIEKV